MDWRNPVPWMAAFEAHPSLNANITYSVTALLNGSGRLLHPEPLQQLDVGIAISVFASLINLVVAKILITVGRSRHSITLEADGKHLMTDVWTTVGIVLGIGLIALGNRFQLMLDFAEQLGMQGWEILDPVIAILVAINILWAGPQLLCRTITGLMELYFLMPIY